MALNMLTSKCQGTLFTFLVAALNKVAQLNSGMYMYNVAQLNNYKLYASGLRPKIAEKIVS